MWALSRKMCYLGKLDDCVGGRRCWLSAFPQTGSLAPVSAAASLSYPPATRMRDSSPEEDCRDKSSPITWLITGPTYAL